ncbi:MAG TPA: T9SS type A sorting domain-containing protein [Chitinophagales bacterium]|nr:T9SS type A sorting domain-containing protein [Chitinophagales bacterium]
MPNPSFEDTMACPASMDGVSNLVYWFSARYSPDYFNVCAEVETPYVSVPNNFAGHQIPLDGHAYAGLIMYQISPPPMVNYREIIATPLSQSLTVGLRYYVSAYIVGTVSDVVHCFANNFGFRFASVRYSSIESDINGVPIDNFSHIRTATIITDTADWVWVGGEFVADSAYQYLMLGNFYDAEHTDTADCIDLPNYGKGAYYYIDKVCVSTDPLENQPTNIIDTEKSTEHIYPNPARNILHIKNTQHYKSFILLNALGQKVKEDKLSEEISSIDISDFSRGVYFLKINNLVTKILFIN